MELNWVEIVISILTGLAAAIPLVVKLVEYVQKAVKEKNWNKMLDMVMDLMQKNGCLLWLKDLRIVLTTILTSKQSVS